MSGFLPALMLLSCLAMVSLSRTEAALSRTERASLPSAVGRLLEVPLWARRAGKALAAQKPSLWGRLGCLDRVACVLGAAVKDAGDRVRRKNLLPSGALEGHQSAFAKGLRHGSKAKCRLAYACVFKKGPAGQDVPPTVSAAVEPLTQGQTKKKSKKTNSKKAYAKKD
uniref:Putative conserved secreted protein n=1 Tax=Ixodes ricinus TaxID=34613 RepID=A0A6B0UZL5_IXORI